MLKINHPIQHLKNKNATCNTLRTTCFIQHTEHNTRTHLTQNTQFTLILTLILTLTLILNIQNTTQPTIYRYRTAQTKIGSTKVAAYRLMDIVDARKRRYAGGINTIHWR